MMKNYLKPFATLLIFTLSFNSYITKAAQQPVAVSATYKKPDTVKNKDFSLKGQYQFMLSRSKNFDGYRLINPSRLASVWKSVNDTLRKERQELATAKAKIAQQNSSISGLKTNINEKEDTLNNAQAKVDEINFLGIGFNKGTYNIIVWSLIIGLALALFIVIARSAKNILEAKHRTQLYEEVNAEYQAFKAKANEKERKLARELQDERNAMEELRSRGR
jgi:hypothetical protein